ncbi:MAG: hypothetical protein JMN27_04480 [gamma proteobacterium endosymbiont of Lamellibrachia anaximandri]|nr:hypothetical protein [gamma proteobacterium endosymbiont of Lamellibrachia anaximandri]MBL3533070.1 hypothetical protein [gamma proteobacterium endosymbiont of Lamellibrachia anaximandri]
MYQDREQRMQQDRNRTSRMAEYRRRHAAAFFQTFSRIAYGSQQSEQDEFKAIPHHSAV